VGVVMTAVRAARWGLLVLALLLSSLFMAWQALAAIDFGYGLWYEVLSIDETVATYGPANDVRPGFERTDRGERERLFGAIVDAVHADGRGLADIVYHDRAGRPIGPLLTAAEITHLQDVADLIRRASRLAWAAMVALVLLAAAAAMRGEPLPAGRQVALGTGIGVALIAAGVLAAGPVRVFYGLHELIFPAGNEWFFHYQESLMSMLMQAPNLFGPIAVSWVALALAIAALLWTGLGCALRRVARMAR